MSDLTEHLRKAGSVVTQRKTESTRGRMGYAPHASRPTEVCELLIRFL
jgi:hypothetical protein